MNLDKGTRYHRLRRRADVARAAVLGVCLFTFCRSGLGASFASTWQALAGHRMSPVLADIVGAGAIAGLLGILLAAVETPFAWYHGYELERRYELATHSSGRWLVDHLKGAAMGTAMGVVAAVAAYTALALAGPWWWLVTALVFTVATLALVQLAPVLLLPLFYEFRPLDRPELVSRLLALAARAGTSVTGVFEWRLSAHTRKANAALAGLGRTRRILLADTLLADFSDEEIETVLAHELAHHVHHDLWRGIALHTGFVFSAAVVADRALAWFGPGLGVTRPSDPAGLPLLVLTVSVWSLAFVPVANALSRRHERRADRFALTLTENPRAFVSALRRLGQQNLAEDRPSPLVQWLFYSHPPIGERIRTAEAWSHRGAPPVSRPPVAEAPALHARFRPR